MDQEPTQKNEYELSFEQTWEQIMIASEEDGARTRKTPEKRTASSRRGRREAPRTLHSAEETYPGKTPCTAEEAAAPEESDSPKEPMAKKGVLARFGDELRREWHDFCAVIARRSEQRSENSRARKAAVRSIIRAKRAKEFPESTLFIGQLFLFLWGMVPYRMAKMKERFRVRRIHRMHRSGRIDKVLNRVKLHPMPFLAATAVLALFVMFFSLNTVGVHVSYQGESLGDVVSAAAVNTACENIENITANVLGNERYTLNRDEVQTTTAIVSRKSAYTEEEFQDALSEKLGLVIYGYGLYIDDELVAATTYPYVLEDMLEQLKYAYMTEETVSCDFAETVEVRPDYYATEYLMDVSDIADLLNSTHQEEQNYTIKKGDTWFGIAKKNDISSATLLKLNPGYNISRLRIGDTLILSAAVPYLTITFTVQQHYIEDIPYEVEYEKDSSMYQGDYKVISPGVYGSADVLADVTYQNGVEISRTVLASVTLTEPVTELQRTGTKPRPTWYPTGSFRWPCTGTVTSLFGGRNLWGRYNYHGGIDIANKAGTPIYAADGGTVTYAGWYSTYGYLVIIDHGNGFETYYGHNSKILVSKGQHVYKGQQIAKMGKTGNASGNHCHFEVRYNGKRQNPMNYLG